MGHLSLYRFSAFLDREASNDYATSDLPYTFDGSYFVMAQPYFAKIFFLEYKIAYLPVHFASLCVDNPRDSAAIPAVLALIETK